MYKVENVQKENFENTFYIHFGKGRLLRKW